MTNLHSLKRKELLEKVLPKNDKIVPVQYIIGNGKSYFDLIVENELEEVVFKDIKNNTPYHINKRSPNWLKCVNYKYAECFILGLRKHKFGWLLAIQEGNDIRPAGIMEFVPK